MSHAWNACGSHIPQGFKSPILRQRKSRLFKSRDFLDLGTPRGRGPALTFGVEFGCEKQRQPASSASPCATKRPALMPRSCTLPASKCSPPGCGLPRGGPHGPSHPDHIISACALFSQQRKRNKTWGRRNAPSLNPKVRTLSAWIQNAPGSLSKVMEAPSTAPHTNADQDCDME